jgi:peptidoglycan hydrolase-like protein with peptidoglycan-binding domain
VAGTCTGPGPCDTKPFGTGDNWVNKVGGLDPYLRAVAHGLQRKGLSESEAIQQAWGILRNWAEGKGNVTPETRARAVKAVANMERKRAQAHSLTADPTSSVDLAWNESLHPRNKGKFAPKGSATTTTGGSLPPEMAANVRDFQRRMKLPVTGVIDTATASRIRALTTPGGKGKGGKRAKARAFAAARRRIGQQVSRVNSLPATQRSQLRQRMPVPPTGYVWTANNNLRAVPLTVAQRRAPLVGV